MGYYAQGSGAIKTAANVGAFTLKDRFKDMLEEAFDEVNFYDGEIEVVHYDDYYHEETTLKALFDLSKSIQLKSAEIDFCGEDDYYWRFRFENGCWYEDPGCITYEKSNNRISK